MEDKSIKIKSDLHREVKVKASAEGQSISEWIMDAIRDKLGPTKREKILDAMAVKPLLKLICDEVALEGTPRSIIVNNVTSKDARVLGGQIDQALEELKELKAIREIPLTKPPMTGDQAVYRRLEW